MLPLDGFPFVRERLPNSTAVGQSLLKVIYYMRCLEHDLGNEMFNWQGADNEVDLLKKSLARSQEQAADSRRELDEAPAVVADRDAQIGTMRDV